MIERDARERERERERERRVTVAHRPCHREIEPYA